MTKTSRGNRLVLLISLVLAASTAFAAPDEELLGKAKGYPPGNRTNWYFDESVRVGSFSNLDKIFPHHTLPHAAAPLPLETSTPDSALYYIYNGKVHSIDSYLDRQRATGLLIVKDGKIIFERYQYDRKPTDKLVSHSMAKSIVSLAVGFALDEKKIRSLDDKIAAYVPELAGYAYGETTIRNLLRMASGVRFSEEYDGKDDLARMAGLMHRVGTLRALQSFNDRETAQGERFHYASIETQVLALALRGATGQTLSRYVAEKIWQPMGAEADATWSIVPDDMERASGSFSATLRDWARLGVMLANDGMRDGRQIIPRDYLVEATDWHKHPDAFAPGKAAPSYGYGYQFWLFPGERRRFALLGVYGQAIFVDPEEKLVLVHTAVAKKPRTGTDPMGRELRAMWTSLVNQYGHW